MSSEWENLGLHLLYLPPHSPELNPIEMLWREMKYEWMDLNVLDSFENFLKHIKSMFIILVQNMTLILVRHLSIYDFRLNTSFTDTFELLAMQFVDDGVYGEIPKRLEFYLDYEKMARDLRMDYCEFESNIIGRVF